MASTKEISSQSLSRELMHLVLREGKDRVVNGYVVLPEELFSFTSSDIKIGSYIYPVLIEQLGEEELVKWIQNILDLLKKTQGLNIWVNNANLEIWEHADSIVVGSGRTQISVWAQLKKTKQQGQTAKFWMM